MWLTLYLAAAAAVLATIAGLVATYRVDLRHRLVEIIAPPAWRQAVEFVIERFLLSQEQAILANAAIMIGLLAVQITLFPIKERLSAAVERDGKLVAEPTRDLPLWLEAIEELKLFLFLVAGQLSVFWLGYSSDPTRVFWAKLLSHLLIVLQISLDFLPPVMQRHGIRYSQIAKTLAAHPVLTLGFGGLFALPTILTVRWVTARQGLSFEVFVVAVCLVQVVMVAWMAIAGTVAGARLVDHAKRMSRSGRWTAVIAWTILLAVLAWNVDRLATIGRSVQRKSSLLRLDYDVTWSSVRFETPGLTDLVGVIDGKDLGVAISLEVDIHNDTGTDAEIEDNRIVLRHHGRTIAHSSLPRLRVAPGQRISQRVRLPLAIKPTEFARFRELLTAVGWEVTLWLELDGGLEFPIFLLDNRK